MVINRTKNASRNIVFGFVNKIILLFIPFILRTLLIYTLGVEYVGLGSLFTSILNILNMAELGISSAIVFSMYSAIANNESQVICALMNFYKKVYRIIGCIVLFGGLMISPFLKYLIADDIPQDVNIYLLFYIYLLQTCLSYFLFAYKNCLFTAHQRGDVTSNINSFVYLFQYCCQALGLLIFKNYYAYVIFIPVTTLISNILVSIFAQKMYSNYFAHGKLDKKIEHEIIKKVKALFLYKVGSVVLTSVDSIVISSYLGLEMLGKYNNYYYIITSLFAFLSVYYNAITPGIGNSLQTENYEKNKKDFDRLFFIQGWLIGWCSVTLLCLYQPFLELWVGEKMMFDFPLVILLVIYFYVWKMMDIVNVYKDAAGLWNYDKYRPLVASIINLILNFVLINFIGIYGIVISTIISIVFVIFPWSTFTVFKYYFNHNIKKDVLLYLLKCCLFFILTSMICVITYQVTLLIPRISFLSILLILFICIIIPNILYLFVLSFFKEYKTTKIWIINKIKILLKRRKYEKDND